MITLDKFKVKVVEENATVGKFEIGPLPKGFGYTLANSVRRILLSSIPGAAIVSVKIAGVKHEYSTIEGVLDDVITIMLRLKELALKNYSDSPVVLKLSVKGKKGSKVEVSAKDFDIPSEIEIINKDMHITTLTADVKFDLEVIVENGEGYAYPDEEKRKELGTLPLDSIFSPVKRAEVAITTARLGQDTDLDQIDLTVYTNGTIKPSEALLKSVEIFDQLANRLVDLLGGDSQLAEQQLVAQKTEEKEVVEEKILVSQLNLSTRLTNSLLNAGISNLKDLENKSREEALSFKGMGKKSMTELEDIMSEKGITFAIN